MTVEELTQGNALDALTFEHFPTRFQAVIWRNWNLIAPEIIAKVLNTSSEKIFDMASRMGLVRDDRALEVFKKRGYFTIIRRNWELLNYEQLLTLLEWTPEKLAFILKEDDFMWHKLGGFKPECAAVVFRDLSKEEEARTDEIKEIIRHHCPNITPAPAVPFDFLERYGDYAAKAEIQNPNDTGLRLAYSYAALCGDPLLTPELDPFPDGLLADYAAMGINAVWLPVVLYKMIPWCGEECADKWQTRLKNLNALIARAERFGIKIYVYLNEPRNMSAAFFEKHPSWQGSKVRNNNAYSLCTAVPEVLKAFEAALEQFFRSVPELGGVFTITMSENQTHCLSKRQDSGCPRCAKRTAAQNIIDVIKVFDHAIEKAQSKAKLISWSWGWQAPWDEDVVRQLPARSSLMVVSEKELPTYCCGITGAVGDYSISKVGPSPLAVRLWETAKARGLKCIAKIQMNTTWELAAVPYIPVPHLVERHLNNLHNYGISDFMVSWTLGGWPGGNLQLLTQGKEDIFDEETLRGLKFFADGFELLPLNSTPWLYGGPQNCGPANLWWSRPSGRKSTMVCFPSDDLDAWCGIYPVEKFEAALEKLTVLWAQGLAILKKGEIRDIAEACYCYYRSALLNIKYIRQRAKGNVKSLLEEEISLNKRLLVLIRRDSRIGFEASNQYICVENDLKEKILNCELLLMKNSLKKQNKYD